MPSFLYGTAWKEDETARLTQLALEAGFRAIDTANQRKHYYEEAVGQGLLRACDALGLERAELWLQSKFTHRGGQDHRLPYDPRAPIEEQVLSSFASSLSHLHSVYLDSYVLHGPSTSQGLSDQDWAAWEAMEGLYQEGVVKALGVSNMSAEQLELLLQSCRVKPKFIQNRCYAQLGWDRAVRRLCEAHDLRYQGFSLLTANRALWQSSLLLRLAERYERSPAALIFSLAQALNMIPLTGTTDLQHMRACLGSSAKLLSPEHVSQLERIYDER
jgi:diketogulonate reductase-like aldo/keto reductase